MNFETTSLQNFSKDSKMGQNFKFPERNNANWIALPLVVLVFFCALASSQLFEPTVLLSKGAVTNFQICKDKTTLPILNDQHAYTLTLQELTSQTVYLCGQLTTDGHNGWLAFRVWRQDQNIYSSDGPTPPGIFYETLPSNKLITPSQYQVVVYSGRELLDEFTLVVKSK